MKKFLIRLVCLLTLLCSVFALGCNVNSNAQPLEPYVSQLKSDIFEGSSDSFALKAFYGFCEAPLEQNGKAEKRVYLLTFRLCDVQVSDVNYVVSFTNDGKTYNADFKLSPVHHALTASIEIENFTLKEFTVNISTSSLSESVTLKSIVPQNTISYLQALAFLTKHQPDLVNSLYSNGNFMAEIHLRLLVKDGKAYWYVGLATDKDNLKALLIDGASGEVLAIREVL